MNIRQNLVVLFISQLALIPSILPAQDTMTKLWEKACEKGREAALEDIAAGKLCIFVFGLPLPDSDYDLYYNILYEDYGISTIGRGCVVTPDEGCYTEVMRPHILKTLGDDVFEKAHRKYTELCASDWVRTSPQFAGGNEGAFRYLYCNLSDDLFTSAEEPKPRMTIVFSVDENGAVTSWEIFRSVDLSDEKDYLAQITPLLNNMPDWKPAIRRGKAVADSWALNLEFTRDMKDKYCP